MREELVNPAPGLQFPYAPLKFNIPRTLKDFSFTGLATALQLYIKENGPILDVEEKRQLAQACNVAAVDQLEYKVKKALDWCKANGRDVNCLVVSGGVASNEYLRSR